MRTLLTIAALLAAPLTLTACVGDDGPAETVVSGGTDAETAAHNATPGHNADGTHVEDAGAAVAAEHTQGAHVEEHDHGSPHGGTVKPAGNGGHLELVVDGQNIKVYPLDGEENGLPVAGITGAQAIVQVEGGSATTVALAPMDDHLHGTLPAGATAYTAIVTVPVAGETRSARFEVGLDGDTDHAH